MAYSYLGYKWGNSAALGTSGGTVTYSFGPIGAGYDGFSQTMSSEYQAVIADAFEAWSTYGDIEFVYTDDWSNADIVIGWDYIDGSSGTLAYTYDWSSGNGLITYSEIYFDLDENWALTNDTTSYSQTSFEAVAIHEIGHALGLDHYSNSIMEAYYGSYLDLTQNDIDAIQSIYGPADTSGASVTLVYYYAYDYASGDIFWGFTYDAGSYGYYDGQTWTTTNENGSSWYFEVTGVYSGYDAYESYSGYNYVYDYYDAETGVMAALYYYDYYGYATGTGGIGSGADYADINGDGQAQGSELFSSYYEADASAGTNVVTYYAYDYASGDILWGLAFDDGSYGYYAGQTWTTTNENGSSWYFEVTGVYSGYDAYESYSGYNYVYDYYDAETGVMAALYYYDYYGYATGTNGIGSGADYADINGDGQAQGSELFSSYYEADASAGTSVVTYYAYDYASGDILWGLAFDDGSYGYYAGQTWTTTNENGSSWYFEVTGVYSGYDAYESYSGYNYVYDYYDAETGVMAALYYYDYYGYATGTNGIGSGADYADINGDGQAQGSELFSSYYEADSSYTNVVYYYAYDYGSGDILWGLAFDDGTYGYYDGQAWTTSDENGSVWYFEVTEVYTGYDAYSAYGGYNYVYDYYDAETGVMAALYYYDYYGYATGTNGIGSGWDYADINGDGVAQSSEYFDSYYEADAGSGTNYVTYYAYHLGSGDYQLGFTFDDGSYGYYDGMTWYQASEQGSYWYYEVTGVYSGYDDYEGYSGYNYVYEYYDGETGNSAVPYYLQYGWETGYDGIGSGWDYADVNGNGVIESSEYFDGYYEADG